jgi:hypothetical protein
MIRNKEDDQEDGVWEMCNHSRGDNKPFPHPLPGTIMMMMMMTMMMMMMMKMLLLLMMMMMMMVVVKAMWMT